MVALIAQGEKKEEEESENEAAREDPLASPFVSWLLWSETEVAQAKQKAKSIQGEPDESQMKRLTEESPPGFVWPLLASCSSHPETLVLHQHTPWRPLGRSGWESTE